MCPGTVSRDPAFCQSQRATVVRLRSGEEQTRGTFASGEIGEGDEFRNVGGEYWPVASRGIQEQGHDPGTMTAVTAVRTLATVLVLAARVRCTVINVLCMAGMRAVIQNRNHVRTIRDRRHRCGLQGQERRQRQAQDEPAAQKEESRPETMHALTLIDGPAGRQPRPSSGQVSGRFRTWCAARPGRVRQSARRAARAAGRQFSAPGFARSGRFHDRPGPPATTVRPPEPSRRP